VTLNQEASQEAALRDAETTSKPSSSSTGRCERVGVPPPASASNASNQFPEQRSVSARVNLTRATTQSHSGTRSQSIADSTLNPPEQPQKANGLGSAPAASENPSGKREWRSVVEIDLG